MPKILPAIYSYEDMKAKWSQDNPDEPPYTRRSDLETGRYALDKWLIRVDDENKTLAVIGWKEHPQHTVTGGLLATARGREIGGNTAALVSARKPQMPQNNPLVTAFKHRDGDNSRWITTGKKAGWAFPDDTELFEQYSSLLPEDVKNDWLQTYPETFGTKPINPEALSKEMYDGIEEFMIAKNERYIRELGESGYNIIDTTNNKRLNTIGLSKSQAKHMLQLLKEGKSVREYTKPRHSRWKSQLKKRESNWINILKVLPPAHYRDYSVPEKDNTHVSNPPKAYDYGTVRAIVRGHYLNRVKDVRGHGTSDTDTDEIEKWVECFKGKSQGDYWIYRKADENNYEIILVDVYTKADAPIKGTNKKFNRKTPTFASLEGKEDEKEDEKEEKKEDEKEDKKEDEKEKEKKKYITKLIVFTNYFKSMTLSQLKKEHSSRAKVDCNYSGEKPNHPKGQVIQQKIKKPDGPPNIFTQNRSTPSRNKQVNNNRGRKKSRNQQGRNKEADFQRNRNKRW